MSFLDRKIVGVTFFVLILISSSFSFYAFNLVKLYAGYEHIYGWTATLGTSSADYGRSITTDSSGNVFTTGYSQKVEVDVHEAYITKHLPDGTSGWTNVITSASSADYSFGIGITTNSGGDVFATGYFSGTVDFDGTGGTDNKTSTSGSADIFITKYNADGSYGWTKTFGGSNSDAGQSITANSGGDVFITGYFYGTVDFDASAGDTDNKTSTSGSADIFITKYNADGSYGWTKTFGASGGENGKSITTNSDGDVFVTGNFVGTVDFDASEATDNKTSTGGNDIFITKYNADGSYGWTKTFGGTGSDIGYGITTNSDGDVFVTGNFVGTVDFDSSGSTDNKISMGGDDIFITKYNADGTYGWTKTFGGASSDVGQSITTNSDGDVFVTGNFVGTVDFDSSGSTDNKISMGGDDIFITKYNADGTYGWTKAFGGTGGDFGYGITTNSDGDVFVTGYFQVTVDFDTSGATDEKTSAGEKDIFITKYTAQLDVTAPTITSISSGKPNGTYTVGEEIDIDLTFSEAVTSTGDVTITLETGDTDRTCTFTITNTFTGTCTYTVQTGDTSLDLNVSSVSGTIKDQSDNAMSVFTPTTNLSTNKAIVIDPSLTDTSGYEYAFTRAFGGTSSDVGQSITTNSGGDVFVTGYFYDTVDFDASGSTDNKTSVGSNDIFITKYNADGTYGWTKVLGGTGSDYGYSITTNSGGDVFVTGRFTGTADFDASGSTDNKTSAGSSDIFITKYNADGTYGWTKTFGGTSSDFGQSITTNSDGDVFVTGYFDGTADFDASGSTDNKTSAGNTDIFITKYNADGTYGWTKALGGTVDDYGNGITTNSGGDVFVTGNFAGTADFDASGSTDNKTSTGGADIFITKYNADGTYGWTKTFGGASTDIGYGITTNSGGDVFATGYFAGTADFDSSEATDSKTSAGNYDIFITKYNADGTYGWTKAFGGADTDFGYGITTNSDGDVFITGYFYGTADFDSSEATDSKTPAGDYDIFITKYNDDGTYGFTKIFGNTGSDVGFGITTNSGGDVFVTGYFSDTVDFYDIGGTDNKISAGSTDIFFTKYTYVAPDTTAPTLSSGLPSGEQSSGTTEVTLSVTTDEDATCKYGTVADTAYASIENTFGTTGGTAHTQTISSLSDGNSYTYYIRCEDGSSNPNTEDYTVSFSVANTPAPPEPTPPTLSSGLPSGEQASGTTEVTLSLTTDESSTCKYGTVADTAYASIANTFSTTGGTTHTQTISGLSDGNSYTYYIRCEDGESFANESDYTISFSVANTPEPPLEEEEEGEEEEEVTSTVTTTGGQGTAFYKSQKDLQLFISIINDNKSLLIELQSMGVQLPPEVKEILNQTLSGDQDLASCEALIYLTKEIKYGDDNNPDDVKLLEMFLNTYEDANLQVDGIYSLDDRDVVIKWQEKYYEDVLEPWGLTRGTGYVYIKSLAKIRQIHESQCQQKEEQKTAPISDIPQVRDLETDMEGPDVKLLQILLNNNGYILTPEGPGSIGNETEYFGIFTRDALIKYQIDNQITPQAGYFGPITRAKMKLQEFIGVWW